MVAPVIVTAAPGIPLVGLKEVIFGMTLKLDELVAVPFGFVTVIFPVVAAVAGRAEWDELTGILGEVLAEAGEQIR